MENLDALLALLLLKQPLAEPIRVFNNPVKIPQWILPSNTELKEFSSPVPVCTMSQCPPGRVSSHRTSRILYAPAQCPSGRALRILSDSVSSVNSQQSSSFVHSLHWLNAHLAELHRTPQSFCLQLCSPTQPCLQGVQQP
jgi:hypothetical protein